MPTTYEPIATTTLTSGASQINFTNISTDYTDLRLVAWVFSSGTVNAAGLRLNGDTASNYSRTSMLGSSTSNFSVNESSVTSIQCSVGEPLSASYPTLIEIEIPNYGGSTNKSVLITTSANRNGSGRTGYTVGLWRSTSAINAVRLITDANNYATGSIVTLFGIKKA